MLQLKFAVAAPLPEETAAEVADKLTEIWRTGVVKVDQAPPIVLEPAPELESEDSSDSREESGPPAAKIPRAEDGPSTWWSSSPERYSDCTDRGCWMGRRREFRNCREYPGLPDKTEYTHVCRLCWPCGGDSSPARPPQPFREMGRR